MPSLTVAICSSLVNQEKSFAVTVAGKMFTGRVYSLPLVTASLSLEKVIFRLEGRGSVLSFEGELPLEGVGAGLDSSAEDCTEECCFSTEGVAEGS